MQTKHNKRESTDDLNKSRYLTKSDCGDGLQGRIKSVIKENISPPGSDPELGRVVLFYDIPKGLVLNKRRGNQISAIAGSKYYDDWPGTVIEMYEDPSIEFKGKVTGGISVRRPAQPHSPVQINEPTSADYEQELESVNRRLSAAAGESSWD